MLAGKRGEDLAEDVWEWLDFFRWEFPLPTHDKIGALVDVELARFEEFGALSQGVIRADHPLVRALVGVMNVFREAYFVAARTVRDVLPDKGVTEKAFAEEYRKGYEASILVGDAGKREGATTMMLKNALSKYAELGYIRLEKGGRGGRETRIFPGQESARIADTTVRLAAAIANARSPVRTVDGVTEESGTRA
jgi:hypothetical protein